ncbi:hypothetical protein SDC9_107065 [bioreactor metagenome]|uniref:Rubrerythrin diiron-binding domain-containing protein n=1 Tax=bioreactor metagenome TaxID=1076179 RepID=A0A645BES5_9ZZZZ
MGEKLINELDGLRVAIEIEKRGHAFYQQAYNQATKDVHKELFLLLRDEESHHMAKFQKVFDKVKENKAEVAFDEGTSKYLTVLASDHVFPKAEEAGSVIADLKTMEAVLAVAMQAEKDSVLFYDELANKSDSDDAIKIFTALKSEEQQHVIKLREMIDAWA